MGVWQDFKDFITGRGVLNTVVAFVIGLAVVALVTAVVVGFVTPLIGLAIGNGNLQNDTVNVSIGDHHATFGVGLIINAAITFLIILLIVFFALVYPVAQMEKRKKAKEAANPTTKDCPFCCSTIPIKATRCPNCTSQLPSDPPAAPKAT